MGVPYLSAGAPLVLASASPRRREILAQLGLEFEVRPAAVDERQEVAREPQELVRRLAARKAHAVAVEGRLVIGADTIVCVGDDILGKPHDAAEAEAMLRRLQGRQHTVWGGLCVLGGGRERCVAEATKVWMRPLSAADLAAYVASGEPMDKAGAYAIQGLGAALVTRVEGCYYNVVGLPVARLVDLLSEFGISVLRRPSPRPR